MRISKATARVVLHHDFKMYRVQGVTVAGTTIGLWIGYATSPTAHPVHLVTALFSSLTLLGIVLVGIAYVRRVMNRDA